MRRLLALGVVMLFAGLLAACGGDSDSDESEAIATVPPPLEGLAAEFDDLVTKGLKEAVYAVSYATRTPEGSPGDTFEVYRSPPRTRIDTIPLASSSPHTSLIDDGSEKAIGCSGGPDAWECVEIEPLGESLVDSAGPIAILTAGELAPYSVTEATGRQVAGSATRCFHLTPPAENPAGESEYCVSQEGVLLYVSSTFGEVEATMYSPDVSESVFEPPARR